MAKLLVFSVRDSRLDGLFMTPFFFAHKGQALRAWEDMCSNPELMMCKHPSDFILFEVGSFDTDTGRIHPHAELQQISTALDVARKPDTQMRLAP